MLDLNFEANSVEIDFLEMRMRRFLFVLAWIKRMEVGNFEKLLLILFFVHI